MGTLSSNILPSATGEDLGSPAQRWDLFAQSVDLSSGLNVLGASTVTNLNNIRYANAFTGADASLQIQAAIADLPSTGGTVDARGFEGSQIWTVDPFTGITKSVHLLLGHASFVTSAAITVPTNCRISGSGLGGQDASIPKGTLIQAASNFPINTPVVTLGRTDHAAHGTVLENLTVSCNSIAGTTGIYSSSINENSGIRNVRVQFCGNLGVFIDGGTATGDGQIAQNYFISSLEVYPSSAGVANTVGLKINGGGSTPQVVENVTFTGLGYSVRPNVGILIDNVHGGMFVGLHAEESTTGILVGSLAAVVGATFQFNDMGGDMTDAIKFSNAFSTVDNFVLPSSVLIGTGHATNVINDLVNSWVLPYTTQQNNPPYFQGGGIVPAQFKSIAFPSNQTPAQTGEVRFTAAHAVKFRNFANNADLNGLSKDSSDRAVVGDVAGIIVQALNTGTVTQTGLTAKYNNISTVSNGVPAEYATVDLTAQGAAITTTTLYAVPASGVGQYRVQWNAKITTVDAVSSTLGALTIGYTDPDGVALTMTAPATILAGTIATSSTGNVTSTALMGLPLMLNCKASTNVTYAFAYVSNTPGQMKFNLHLKLEAL